MIERESIARRWTAQFVITVFTAYFYVLMEWLFFATKPSFMNGLGVFDKAKVLLVSPLPIAAAGAALLFILWLPAMVWKARRAKAVSSAAGMAVPALVLGLAFLLLIDNFTYIVFHFGIKTIAAPQSLAYAALIVALAAFTYIHLGDLEKRLIAPGRGRFARAAAAALLIVSAVLMAAGYNPSGLVKLDQAGSGYSPDRRPNILIIASDGLNASHMSAYGYKRETTPFIKRLAGGGLLCENCFTNAGSSGGSIASTFTGRLPTQTRCIYPPDILMGLDTYWHLPGILKKIGYKNFDISIKHYADPYDMNMKRSFDEANYKRYRTVDNAASELMTAVFGPLSEYFLTSAGERISERILHAFLIRPIDDAYKTVTNPVADGVRSEGPGRRGGQTAYVDQKAPRSIQRFFQFIDGCGGPFFAHLHLLGTHGPRFKMSKNYFSAGKKQNKDWMDDFYDDAIIDFDGEVKMIVNGLAKMGVLDETVIVICTDHGQRFSINQRLPLIFVFPDSSHVGRISENVQNLDIAPTLLDYIGIEKPDRMEGVSLISGGVDPDRPIFSVDRKHGSEVRVKGKYVISDEMLKPPFYSLGSLGVFLCDRLYKLRMEDDLLTVCRIEGHTAPCGDDRLPDIAEVEQMLIDHLEENGYDTSSITRPVKVKYMDEQLLPFEEN